MITAIEWIFRVPSWGVWEHLDCFRATHRSLGARTAASYSLHQPPPNDYLCDILPVPCWIWCWVQSWSSPRCLEALSSICPLICGSSFCLTTCIVLPASLTQVIDLSLRVGGSRGEADFWYVTGDCRSLEDSFLSPPRLFCYRVNEVGGQRFLTAPLFFLTGQEASASEMDD